MNILLNALLYIQKLLKIRDKEGRLIGLILNPPQMRLYEAIRAQWKAGMPVRIIILKARQMGFSTLVVAIVFWLTATSSHVDSMIVAHKDEATANLFRMAKLFLDSLPDRLRPMTRASNAKELVFDLPTNYKGNAKGLGSRIRCATAGGAGVGRSYTLRCLHLSEYAFWPGNKATTFTGLVASVPDKPGTLIVIESTANGYDDFKKKWDAAVKAQRDGLDGYVPIFFAWYEMPDYRRKPRPGFVRTEEEQALAETYGLDDEQLAWRRWCIAEQCGGDIDLFHQEYPCSPDEAFISTGRCAFDKTALVLRRKQVQDDTWEQGIFRITYDTAGKIDSWKWEPEAGGPIRIRKKVEPGVPYVLGGDTAGTGSDFFAGHVLDNRTGEQVAVVHHQFDERMFAVQVFCLGMYYNRALIGLEINYSTYPQMRLEELGYPNLYVRERYDTFTGQLVNAYGFETTPKTRPVIVDGLKDVAKYAIETITDYDTLGEMLTFVYDERWKPQAEVGEHDDLVMALAIAHAIRGQQRTTVQLEGTDQTVLWTEDMWEDYNRASSAEREMLIRKWGNPS